MDYYDELDTHRGFQQLARVRGWYRTNLLLKWPKWMPGIAVLAWRLDIKMYLMQQKIENEIYSRRVAEYKREKYERFMMSTRYDREKPPRVFYTPWNIPSHLTLPAR